jgi:hypothetical protein
MSTGGSIVWDWDHEIRFEKPEPRQTFLSLGKNLSNFYMNCPENVILWSRALDLLLVMGPQLGIEFFYIELLSLPLNLFEL